MMFVLARTMHVSGQATAAVIPRRRDRESVSRARRKALDRAIDHRSTARDALSSRHPVSLDTSGTPSCLTDCGINLRSGIRRSSSGRTEHARESPPAKARHIARLAAGFVYECPRCLRERWHT
jgi:hypothetical protein